MKVLLLSRYSREGASSRVRMYQYMPYLEAYDVKITVSPLFNKNYLDYYYKTNKKSIQTVFFSYLLRLIRLTTTYKYDLLWVEKELFPYLPAWGEVIINTLKIPYIVDYDDAVFHNYDLNRNNIVRTILSNKIDLVMRKAALVIVGNDYLRERAQRAGAKRIELLPSVVDAERYKIGSTHNGKSFTIGWIGSPSTTRYVKYVESALSSICARSNAKLVLVGAGEITLNNVQFDKKGWSEESEVNDIQTFDVGIMPLPDMPWERGKCGYKLIQYMACGCPVVASPVGVNRQIVENGVNGFLVSTMDEWLHALRTLRDDPALRERMGRAGRNKVEMQYCIQVTVPRLVQLLRNAAIHIN